MYAEPKSVNLTLKSASSKTFSGFISRCTMPLECIQRIASTICAVYQRAEGRCREPYFLTKSERSPFGASSRTKSSVGL